jgi:hypothetical protein
VNILRGVATTVAIGTVPLVVSMSPAQAASHPPTPAGLTLSVTSTVLPLTDGSLTAQLGLQSSTAEQVTVSPATMTLTPSGVATCDTRPDPAWSLRITPGKASYAVAPGAPVILSVAITRHPGVALSPGTHLVGITASTQNTGLRQAACSYFRVTDPTTVAPSRILATPHKSSLIGTALWIGGGLTFAVLIAVAFEVAGAVRKLGTPVAKRHPQA